MMIILNIFISQSHFYPMSSEDQKLPSIEFNQLTFYFELLAKMQPSVSNKKLRHHGSKSENFNSPSVKRNSQIFGYTMLFLQIGFSLIYAFLFNVEATQFNAGSVVITIGLAILVIAGFGLVFGYTKRLVWSGIGFSFFITAFCIQVYPLINDFWTKVKLQSISTTDFSYSNKMYNLYLSDRQTGTVHKTSFYGNSITNAIKCALSVSIAFSALLGRAGHLECLIVTAFGIIGFQLNRQIIQQNQGTDTFGTFYIFVFGGFMSFTLGLLSFLREKKDVNRLDIGSMKKYTGSDYSVIYSLFGALIIFALFPLLSYELDAYSRYNNFSPYTNPVCVIIAMGGGALGSIMISFGINGYVILRDAIHGPIAGAIAVGASSLYITSPVYALVAGVSGGVIQALIQNLIEKRTANKRIIISTVSWSLFGIQGLIGAAFAAGWKAIYFTNTFGLTIQSSTLNNASQFQFYGGLISAGIGAGFGLIAGFLVILVNGQLSREYFQDYFYWFAHDGIRYDNALPEKQQIPPRLEIAKPQIPIINPQPQKQPAVLHQNNPNTEKTLNENLSAEHDQFDFSESNDNLVNPYAFL